jgi:copper(I)-binding protein
MKRVAAILLAVAAAGPAAAQTKVGELTISGAVIRAAPAGVANTAGYLTIANAGARPDRLIAASCACAGRVEVHITHVMNGTAMMMASAAEVPAGGQVSFAPGGLHLMITGLKGPLADGQSQPLTLKFAHAGQVSVPFAVMSKIETGR